MKLFALLLSLFLFPSLLFASNDALCPSTHIEEIGRPCGLNKDSLPHFKKRQRLVAGASLVVYGGSLIALNKAWYDQYTRTSFHTYNDAGEWLQMDKVGHAWTAYNLSRISTSVWRWAGSSEKKSVLIGSLSGFGYLTVIELLDAHSQKWGWSWADMGANAAGSGLFAFQQLAWKEQRIQFKFSAWPKKYDASLTTRANDLFGHSLPERLLKDYNGQTYWFSVHLKSFAPDSKLPKWLSIAAGYGADGMFGGYENIGYDKNGTIIFNRPDIKRRRQWYISPDIDFSHINTNSKLVRTLFSALNAIKLPAPALEFSNGRLKGHWIHF